MADSFVGEIRQFGGNFAPVNWAFCNGQLLSISEYDTLFALIGTTYGGDGQNTFGLPNLQGRVPVHQGTYQGTTFALGQVSGQEQVTLTSNQLPVHSHPVMGASAGGSDNPSGNTWGSSPGLPYAAPPGTVTMNPGSVGASGNSQPHNNMHPYLAVSYIISLYGIYPTQQ